MRSIRLVALAATMALLALGVVGVASAAANEETVFCKANVAECANENYLGHAFKTGGFTTKFKLSEGATVQCTGVMERTETEQLNLLSFTACNEGCTVTASGLPYATDLHEPISGNGKLSLNVTGLVFKCSSSECTFSTGKTVEFPVEGGAIATIKVNQSLGLGAGGVLCPKSVQWEGEYKTKFAPGYVTKRGISGPALCMVNEAPCPAGFGRTEEAFSLAPKSEVVFGNFAGVPIKCAASSFSVKNYNVFIPGGEWRYESPTLSSCVGTPFTSCTLAWEKAPYSATLEATGGGTGVIHVTESLGAPHMSVSCFLAGAKFTCGYVVNPKTLYYKLYESASLSGFATLTRSSGPGSVCSETINMSVTGKFASAKSPLYMTPS